MIEGSPRLLPLTRRSLLAVLASGAAVAGLSACSENPATGRRQLVVVSDAQLAEMADAAWTDLAAKTPVLRDPAVQRRLAKVGGAVAEAAGRNDLSWDFVVFDQPDINAFVLPNGKVGFFRGLIDFARSDHELAAVMGHEAGHVVARHAAERVSQQAAVQLGVGLAQAVLSESYGENAGDIAGILGMGAHYGVLLPYSRKHELEADRLGVSLMKTAGYDPIGAVQFWNRMLQAEAEGGRPLEFLSTHPAGATRLAALKDAAREAAGLAPPQNRSVLAR